MPELRANLSVLLWPVAVEPIEDGIVVFGAPGHQPIADCRRHTHEVEERAHGACRELHARSGISAPERPPLSRADRERHQTCGSTMSQLDVHEVLRAVVHGDGGFACRSNASGTGGKSARGRKIPGGR